MSDFPQPPKVSESRFDDWLFRWWTHVSSGGSSETVVAAPPTSHTSLTDLNSSEYTHLTSTEKDDLTDGLDSSSHFHNVDRDRNNHFGQQEASTISDFDVAVLAAIGGVSDSVLQSQIFGG